MRVIKFLSFLSRSQKLWCVSTGSVHESGVGAGGRAARDHAGSDLIAMNRLSSVRTQSSSAESAKDGVGCWGWDLVENKASYTRI